LLSSSLAVVAANVAWTRARPIPDRHRHGVPQAGQLLEGLEAFLLGLSTGAKACAWQSARWSGQSVVSHVRHLRCRVE
jgi:hypothetical protein